MSNWSTGKKLREQRKKEFNPHIHIITSRVEPKNVEGEELSERKVILQSCNQISKNNKQYSKVLNQVRSPWSKFHDKHFRIQFF